MSDSEASDRHIPVEKLQSLTRRGIQLAVVSDDGSISIVSGSAAVSAAELAEAEEIRRKILDESNTAEESDGPTGRWFE